MALRIVHYNDPILRKKGAKITAFDAALTDLADAMVETMHEAHGIGLAAQQVGRAIQLCVIDLSGVKRDFTWDLDGKRPPLDLWMPLALINPVVTVLPGDDYEYEEGCLSFPEIRADVIRPDAISVRYQDILGTPHVLVCDGLLARCIQHEADHLNGVLFIDRMEKKIRAGIDKAVKELAKQTREEAAAAESHNPAK